MNIDLNQYKEEHSCQNCIYHNALFCSCNHLDYGEIIAASKSHCVGFTNKSAVVNYEYNNKKGQVT